MGAAKERENKRKILESLDSRILVEHRRLELRKRKKRHACGEPSRNFYGFWLSIRLQAQLFICL